MNKQAIGYGFLALALLAFALTSSSASADITTTGDAGPDPSSYNYYYIGRNADGTLRVDGASTLSTWDSYIGYNSGMTGAATVTGARSVWSNSNNFYVGCSGSGSLTVADGGIVTTRTLWASLSDLHGNGTIRTGGAVLDGDLVFDSAHGLTQSMGFGSGGTLNLNMSDISALGVGYKGSGTLRIAQAQSVASYDGYLGYYIGSTGTATVTGTESKWANRSHLYVGYSGNGTLNIEAGAQASNGMGYIGYDSGSTGTVTVTGTGSTWTNNYDLYVGKLGSGSLTVADGGLVTATTIFASPSDLHGNGTIEAVGAVLDADLVFDAEHGLKQTLAFGTGGNLNLNILGQGRLGVGYKGAGTLRVADGRLVGCTILALGYHPGSYGTATITSGARLQAKYVEVGWDGSATLRIEDGASLYAAESFIARSANATLTGPGSVWVTSRLCVADGGSLTVADSGAVSTEYLSASLNDLHGNGTISTKGVALDASLIFDAAHGSAQELLFGEGGTLKFNIDSTSELGVGTNGTGTLLIAEGQAISCSHSLVGFGPDARGTATIAQTGTSWTIGSTLYVGSQGTGRLLIESGATVRSDSSSVGLYVDSFGAVTARGSGSTWTTAKRLYVGNRGSGTLDVEGGAAVSSAEGYIGSEGGSAGAATVTGAGSTWTNSSSLDVGYLGSGMLNIADHGRVTAPSVTINKFSTISLHVSGSDMLVLGNAVTTGKVTNNGTIRLYADAFLPAATYKPISDCAGRFMGWEQWLGNGAYVYVGGTWDWTARSLVVLAPVGMNSGSPCMLTTGERLIVTDAASGRRFGAAFGVVPAGAAFSAAPTSPGDLAALADRPTFGGAVLDAWSCQTSLSNGEAMLSFDIGLGRQNLELWHLQAGSWSRCAPSLLTYDEHGILSFATSDLTSYAVVSQSKPLLVWAGNMGAASNDRWDNVTANFISSFRHVGDIDNQDLVFDDSASGSTTITRAGTLRPASIVVDNTAKTYTFGGTGKLTGPMSLDKYGIGTLTLSGPVDYTGGTTVHAGLLQVATALNSMLEAKPGATVEASADLSVNAPLKLAPGATLTLKASQHTRAPQFDPAAKVILSASSIELSIQDSAAPGSISPATLTNVWTLVRSGYNGPTGAWTGTGITSTAVTNPSLNGLGLVLADAGQTLTVREMILGDVNGDNKVTIGDVMVALNSANYQQDGTWLNGDVNYDGKVTIGDVMLMLNSTRYQQDYNPANAPAQIAALEAAGLGSLASAAVPEPASLAVLAIGAMSLIGRRRRI